MEKVCSKCQVPKPVTEFRRNVKSQDGYQSACKDCQKKRDKLTYVSSEVRKAQITAGRRARTLRAMKFIRAYLELHPCVDCGETDPVVLEFDHVRGTKTYDVSSMLQRSLEQIEQEIAKCDVRCANCHKRKTAKQFNWYASLV